MAEDIKNQTEGKNTVALVGMICSIIGVILLLTIIGSPFGLIFLIIGFVLGIIGLFYKPKTKARVAILIPVIIRICLCIGFLYIKDSIKTPALEFNTWFETTIENETYGDILEDDRFGDLFSDEFKNLINGKSENEIMELYDNSNGSNSIEKRGYVFFGLIKDSIEVSLEKYNNLNSDTSDNEILDIDEEDIIDDEDSDEDSDENIDEEDNNENDDKIDDEEISKDNQEQEPQKAKTENVEIFNNGEKNDIEEIINILE